MAQDDGAGRRILILEDERVFARALCKHLEQEGYQPDWVECIQEAEQKLPDLVSGNGPRLVLLDMRLPDGSGLDFLRQLRAQGLEWPVLVMSAYGEIEDAVAAMKLGAADYLKKPFDLNELKIHVKQVLEHAALNRQLDYSSTREQHTAERRQLIGESVPMRDMHEQLRRIASLTDNSAGSAANVLITGETGTGKDLAAHLLHSLSTRAQHPFVHVDCAALPRELIEAELFGHEKGAFTSAHVSRTGLIEAAENGTLFLDEIGEVPLELQAKLLAVLERRTLRRIGSTQERKVDAWIIAATNRDLVQMAAEGRFRSDLYYRLNVLCVRLPALRERGADITLLARHFAACTARRYGLHTVQIRPDTERCLRGYAWPGNVRELKHMIERAALLSNGLIQPENLAIAPDPGGGAASIPVDAAPAQAPARPAGQAGSVLDENERELIVDTLEQTGGNISRAARSLGITRMTLRYRMQKYGLKKS